MLRRLVTTCDPCRTASEDKDTEGYCASCGEYYCDCLRSNPRCNTTRKIVMMEKDSMPGAPRDLTASAINMSTGKEADDDLNRNETYVYVKEICIEDENDEEDCLITGMVLVSNVELVLVDFLNKSLKHVDAENNSLKGILRLPTDPHGITAISEDHIQVAAALPNSQEIKFVSISEGLSVVRTLKTNGPCVDITCINGKLCVSFWKPLKFQILGPTGEVYKTIEPTAEVQKYCTVPSFIAVCPDKSMIYVSGWETNKVLCMDMNGSMISMYQGELDKPGNIIISPLGSVYLCNTVQHVVYKITSDLSEATEILGREDGLVYPAVMCFNAGKQHLYISSTGKEAKYRNFIKVYTVLPTFKVTTEKA